MGWTLRGRVPYLGGPARKEDPPSFRRTLQRLPLPLPPCAEPAVPPLRRLLLSAVLLGLAASGLAACSGNYSPNNYAAAAAQQANAVTRGVIIGVRQVTITPSGTVGAVAGGAAGGVAGSQTPGGVVASAFGAIGGTLLGGLAGGAAEQAADKTKAWEYIVQQTDGKLVSVTQTDKKPFAIGTHVLVIAGKQARIVRDYTVALPAKPTKAVAETEPTPAPIIVMPLATPATDGPAPKASAQAPEAAAPAAGTPSPAASPAAASSASSSAPAQAPATP